MTDGGVAIASLTVLVNRDFTGRLVIAEVNQDLISIASCQLT
ncbi:MAG: hypothetical protein ACLSH6_04825 [Limosilactobacillus pontis]